MAEIPTGLGWKVAYRPGTDLEAVEAAGFDTVFVRSWGTYFGEDYLNKAESLGLKVIVPTTDASFVNKWKHHPAIVAWMTYDEPEAHGTTKETQKAAYDAMKAADPTRPIGVTYQFTANTKNYFEPNAFDFYFCSRYPFVVGEATWQANLLDAIDNLKPLLPIADDKPMIPVIQGTYTTDESFLTNPTGHIAEIYDLYLEEGLDPSGIAFWVWGFSGETGMGDDPIMLEEVTKLLNQLSWEPLLPKPTPPVYTCPYCPATFSSPAELEGHIASEHPVPVFTCPHCPATFATQGELDIHIASQHPIAAEVPWYKKYAPYLAIGGAITAVIAYFTLKKRG